MLHDLRVAVRSLIQRPGFALSVILTLALGIGASTMMFSLVDSALLRPLPFEKPDRLAMLWGVAGPQRAIRGGSFPEVQDWRAMNRTFADVAIYNEMSLNLRLGDGGDSRGIRNGVGRLLQPARRARRARPYLQRRRRSRSRRAAGCHHQRQAVARALRRCRRHPAASDRPERSHVHDRRRHACGVCRSFLRDRSVGAFDDGVADEHAERDEESRRAMAVGARTAARWRVTRAGAGRYDTCRRRARAAYPDSNRQRGVQIVPLKDACLARRRG